MKMIIHVFLNFQMEPSFLTTVDIPIQQPADLIFIEFGFCIKLIEFINKNNKMLVAVYDGINVLPVVQWLAI